MALLWQADKRAEQSRGHAHLPISVTVRRLMNRHQQKQKALAVPSIEGHTHITPNIKGRPRAHLMISKQHTEWKCEHTLKWRQNIMKLKLRK